MIVLPRVPLFPSDPRRRAVVLSLLITFWLAGCDRSPFNDSERALDQAEQKQAAQDFRGAANSYERALDGTSKTADVHFRLGLLYDGKLDDPVGAVHHFRRYIEFLPNGPHAKEAQANLDRIELTLATKLAGGTLITHSEAVRLKNENKDLKAQLAARNNPVITYTALGTGGNGTAAGKGTGRDAGGKPAPGSRTYLVQPGDTLASISRKFYNTKARAKDIQDANLNAVPDATKLRKGTTLIIP